MVTAHLAYCLVAMLYQREETLFRFLYLVQSSFVYKGRRGGGGGGLHLLKFIIMLVSHSFSSTVP